jgi:hypothetical protein
MTDHNAIAAILKSGKEIPVLNLGIAIRPHPNPYIRSGSTLTYSDTETRRTTRL